MYRRTKLDENLGEVIWVARPTEEALIAYGGTRLVCLFETILLNVADSLYSDSNRKANDRQYVGRFVESWLSILIHLGTVEQCDWHADSPDL